MLWPFAWIMGTPAIDCKQVATLIGVKTFLNEFVAYDSLATLRKNRLLIQSWENDVMNQTAMYDGINNCWQLANSTYTHDCLSTISVSVSLISCNSNHKSSLDP